MRSAAKKIDHQNNAFNELGYVVIDDFLPEESAHRLYELYSAETNWEQQDQLREKHYQHVFKTNSPFLPRENEHYIAKFGRSKQLEQSEEFQTIYDQVVKKRIAEELEITLTSYDTRCYRLLPGDVYRTHIDDYAGDVGLVYYLNKRWIADWGGMLHVCHDKGDEQEPLIVPILPRFNRAVLISHKTFRFPHFVSSVEPFALEPRYTIVSFNR